MAIPQGVWKQHLRPRMVVGYGIKIFLSSPPNYVTRSPGIDNGELEHPTFLRHGWQPEEYILHARTVMSPRFLN